MFSSEPAAQSLSTEFQGPVEKKGGIFPPHFGPSPSLWLNFVPPLSLELHGDCAEGRRLVELYCGSGF